MPQGLVSHGVVAEVVDGDTLRLEGGEAVRLVQVDTPEVAKPHDPGAGECHGSAAARVLERLAPPGTRVRLVRDPALDDRDDYDRLLRWAWVDKSPGRGAVLVQHELVRRGAATPWFFDGQQGEHAGVLIQAAHNARVSRRGLWGMCHGTQLNVQRPATTGPAVSGAKPGMPASMR